VTPTEADGLKTISSENCLSPDQRFMRRRSSFFNAGFHLFAAVNSTIAEGNGESDAGCISLHTFFCALKESMTVIGAVTPWLIFIETGKRTTDGDVGQKL